ncbi:site-specific integrase [Pseudanabaena sp. FACHB-2040]|uniref:site-specific integrase n=1 Tax=Pseudanabaena sp. FACHB-2040 TaxID=2692859 RepID=UPI00168735D1|nr:site-specific integrase [Pseudanabaena sp. FACHB-2040]MBD2261100.1 site-specific integrase [Pseudanabaena sp. FACHB-2040]
MKNSNLDQQLKAVNARLKAAKLGVSIRQRGNSLYIRAMLPPKAGSGRTQWYQQDFPTGFKAHPAGLKAAEKLAKQIAGELAGKTFDWSNHGFTSVKIGAQKTVAQWSSDYKEHYFHRRQRTPTTEETWNNHYECYLKRLPQCELLTEEVLRQAILMTEPDSYTRNSVCIAYKALGKFAGLNVEFTQELKGAYSARHSAPRSLPSDEEIVQAIRQIPRKDWRWIAAMIATYGLRPHEAFKLDLSCWPEVEVLEKTKTGRRTVRAPRPEWVDLFDLGNHQRPRANCRTNRDFGHRVSKKFRTYSIPFRPYDLRHAWAVRAICYRFPVELAAKWMGHSVKIHTEVYEAWISKETEEEIYRKAIADSNRPQAPTVVRGSQDLILQRRETPLREKAFHKKHSRERDLAQASQLSLNLEGRQHPMTQVPSPLLD